MSEIRSGSLISGFPASREMPRVPVRCCKGIMFVVITRSLFLLRGSPCVLDWGCKDSGLRMSSVVVVVGGLGFED